jgi:SAM-dependent methyltransferase
MDLLEQRILGEDIDRHWYYASKRRALLAMIGDAAPRKVLDIGAGSGFFARALLRDTPAREAICVDPNYPAERNETEAGKPIVFRHAAAPDGADLMLLMDVLEHVDDDVGLLQSYVGAAASGTRVLITVPAFRCLWSGHDVFLGHRRRYTVAAIEDVARRAGLTVERGCYFFAAIFPIAAALRLPAAIRHAVSGTEPAARSEMRRHGIVGNTVLGSLSSAELPVFRRNRLFGLTAFVLARVP